MYKVIKAFDDLQDAVPCKGGILYHHYNIGDVYPRKGYDPTLDRFSELASSDNAQGEPLIVEQEKPSKKDKALKE